ncbi:MAG: 2-(1,2-epoxy-1,2-dihydrophenyl)acetyl-CoA isomerase [Sphingomonadales bacterium]|nr:MAG: 2-(1,2-epoxy-1,2-dihydrophenyl)acetyl-CoA isomerase [Sphingomonadales bacterium]
MMAEGKVTGELRDGIARLIIDYPARRNAISEPMVEQAIAAFDRIVPEARVLLISGAGDHFCSGANLAFDPDMDVSKIDGGAPLLALYNPLIRRIAESPVPVITSVRGAAAGYGASLALAGDIILAEEKAFFALTFRALGIVPDGGAAWMLVKAIGRVRAMELMMLGERLPAPRALDWGLITRVYQGGDALAEATETLARELATGPTVALGRIRRLAWLAAETSFEDDLNLEADYQRECVRSEDVLEGLAAFREKRAPQFKGR